jgi:hypothetical protein
MRFTLISGKFAQVSCVRHGPQTPPVLARNRVLITFHLGLAAHDKIVPAGFINKDSHPYAWAVLGQCFFIEAVIAVIVVLSAPANGIEVA